MGQQQLILLVLGIVLVGLAVTVGITQFGEKRRESEMDAMTLIATEMADDLVAWYHRPAIFGGHDSASCPFERSVASYGRTTLTGRPFAANLPAYPAPASTTWIDAGGGHYIQTIPAQDLIRVVSRQSGDLAVELRVHGPDPSCRSLRRRTYAGGAWSLDAPHTDVSSCAAPW